MCYTYFKNIQQCWSSVVPNKIWLRRRKKNMNRNFKLSNLHFPTGLLMVDITISEGQWFFRLKNETPKQCLMVAKSNMKTQQQMLHVAVSRNGVDEVVVPFHCLYFLLVLLTSLWSAKVVQYTNSSLQIEGRIDYNLFFASKSVSKLLFH